MAERLVGLKLFSRKLFKQPLFFDYKQIIKAVFFLKNLVQYKWFIKYIYLEVLTAKLIKYHIHIEI